MRNTPFGRQQLAWLQTIVESPDGITVTGEGPSYWIARDAAIVNSPLSEEEWGLFPALDDLVARSVMGKVRKLQGKES